MSAEYYKTHAEARRKKIAYQSKFNKRPEQREHRTQLRKARRHLGIDGKGGKDVSHCQGEGVVLESPKRNRARNGANGKSTKKKCRK